MQKFMASARPPSTHAASAILFPPSIHTKAQQNIKSVRAGGDKEELAKWPLTM